jgi:hypothetical protein
VGVGTDDMAGNIISLDQVRQDRAATAVPEVSADDFSIKVVCDGDPMFWIRLERPAGRNVRVTDFKRGTQRRELLSEGFLAALDAAGIAMPAQLRFSNIAPMGPSDPQFSHRLTEAIADVRSVAEAVARRGGTTIRSLDARPRGDKVDAEAVFTVR